MRGEISNILLAPIVSEKTTASGERENSIAFWVHPHASKRDIKAALKILFPDVVVDSIRTLIKGGQNVRFGRQEGRRKKMKKAYIKLAPGQQINLLENE